jgi:hypothetical protein
MSFADTSNALPGHVPHHFVLQIFALRKKSGLTTTATRKDVSVRWNRMYWRMANFKPYSNENKRILGALFQQCLRAKSALAYFQMSISRRLSQEKHELNLYRNPSNQ